MLQSTVTMILNNGSSTKPYKVRVLAFDLHTSRYIDVTKETYDRMELGMIQNITRGVDIPKIDYKDSYLIIKLKSSDLNKLYAYYIRFLHSCIPDRFKTPNDVIVDLEDYESRVGVKASRKPIEEVAEGWLSFMRNCETTPVYMENF